MESKMKNFDNTKKLVTSSILVALMVIFSLLGTLPFFSTISLAVAPMIVALIYHKGGRLNALIAFVVTLILTSILINPIYGITMTLLNYSMGAGLVFMIEKNISPLINFIVLTVAVAAGFIIMVVVDIKLISNLSIMEYIGVIVDQMKAYADELIKTSEGLGLESNGNASIEALKAMDVKTMVNMIPSMLALYSLAAATFIYKISNLVFKRMRIIIKPFPKLSEIKTNMFVVMGTLLLTMGGIGLVYLGVEIGEGIMLMGNNLFTISGTVGGISLLSYYMEHKMKYPAVFRILILFFILSSSLVSVIAIVGIIDSAFDFRKLSENGLYTILKSKTKNTKQ